MKHLSCIPEDRVAVRAREAAAMLRVSVRTLAYWTANGTVPSTKVDGIRLYPVGELHRFLERRMGEQGGGR